MHVGRGGGVVRVVRAMLVTALLATALPGGAAHAQTGACFRLANPIEVVIPGDTRSVAVADFNDDGKLDFPAVNADDNTVSVQLGDGTGGLKDARPVPGRPPAGGMALGNLNGDGQLGLAVASSGNGAHAVSVRPGDGRGGLTPRPADHGAVHGGGWLRLLAEVRR